MSASTRLHVLSSDPAGAASRPRWRSFSTLRRVAAIAAVLLVLGLVFAAYGQPSFAVDWLNAFGLC